MKDARRAYDPDHCTACGDFLPCGDSWIDTTIGPDGFTNLAGDAAYDRLHGVDGYSQVSDAEMRRDLTATVLRVIQRTADAQGNVTMLRAAENIADAVMVEARKHYAAFCGAEAELARLRSAANRVGHQAVCPIDPCDCWMQELTTLLGDEL